MWLLHNFQNTVLYNLSGLLLLIFDSVQSDINLFAILVTEAGTGGVLWKISQNAQENTCVGVLFLI